MAFIEKYTFDQRYKQSSFVLKKYPTRVPVIVENIDTNIPKLDKNKYLVPYDMMYSQFLYTLRKRLKLSPKKGVFLMINNSLFSGSLLMNNIYISNLNADGFLYVKIYGENVFG
jgi:GABA(A) receptor-associated protein